MIPAAELNEMAEAINQIEHESDGTDFIELTTDRGVSEPPSKLSRSKWALENRQSEWIESRGLAQPYFDHSAGTLCAEPEAAIDDLLPWTTDMHRRFVE